MSIDAGLQDGKIDSFATSVAITAAIKSTPMEELAGALLRKVLFMVGQ